MNAFFSTVPRGQRVLVCGGRNYADETRVNAVLSILAPAVIIEGCARGADHLAEMWAASHNVPILHFPADWVRWRGLAGPRRNAQMLSEGKPDLVVAFKGGTGTADMIARAAAAGVPVVRP